MKKTIKQGVIIDGYLYVPERDGNHRCAKCDHSYRCVKSEEEGNEPCRPFCNGDPYHSDIHLERAGHVDGIIIDGMLFDGEIRYRNPYACAVASPDTQQTLFEPNQ